MAGLTVVTAASGEAVTESEMQSYLRIDSEAELSTLRLLRRAARAFCEEYTGRTLMTTVLKLSLDATNEIDDPLWEGTRIGPYLNFYKNHLVLPKAPLQSVTSLVTYDDADNGTTMDASRYYVDTSREPGRIVLRTGETFPTALRVANAIEVTYTAGYGTSANIPEALKVGMLMHIAYMYDQRGDMKDYLQTRALPPMVEQLYKPYKVMDGLGSSKLMALG